VEIWGQHGDWAFLKSQKWYIKHDGESLLSVSKAAIKLPIMNVPLALPFDIRDDEGKSMLLPLMSWMTLSPLWKRYLLTLFDG
jgi:hypothetical protein